MSLLNRVQFYCHIFEYKEEMRGYEDSTGLLVTGALGILKLHFDIATFSFYVIVVTSQHLKQNKYQNNHHMVCMFIFLQFFAADDLKMDNGQKYLVPSHL